MNPFLHILYAALGSLGFCFFLHVDKKHFLAGAVNGAAAWALYLLLERFGLHIFVCNVLAALLAAIFAEIFSRRFKAPAVVFYIPGIVPLVPGSTLYYMMEALVQTDYRLAGQKAFSLLWTLLGIGVGCAFVIAGIDIWRKLRSARK